jgi:hypothetical protein
MSARQRTYARKRDGRLLVLRTGDGQGDVEAADWPVVYGAELEHYAALDAATQDAVLDVKQVFGPGTRLITEADIPPVPLPEPPPRGAPPAPRGPGGTGRVESGELWPSPTRPGGADEGAPVRPSLPTGAHRRDGQRGV